MNLFDESSGLPSGAFLLAGLGLLGLAACFSRAAVTARTARSRLAWRLAAGVLCVAGLSCVVASMGAGLWEGER